MVMAASQGQGVQSQVGATLLLSQMRDAVAATLVNHKKWNLHCVRLHTLEAHATFCTLVTAVVNTMLVEAATKQDAPPSRSILGPAVARLAPGDPQHPR